jgi:hypothetical protein
MTSDRSDRQPPTDDEIGRLVRDVASEWHQPPHRLGQAMWRDRVGRRWGGWLRRPAWLPRLAGAAAVGLVATVVVAIGVAWLNTAGGPGSGSTPTPGPTTATVPTPSALPKLVVYGAAPQAAGVLVETNQGLARVDLRTGDLAPTDACKGVFEHSYLRLPDGGVLALCKARTPSLGSERVEVSLERVSGSGGVNQHVVVGSYVGSGDQAAADNARPAPVVIDATVSPDGRWVYVGWAEQQGSRTWRMGVDTVPWPPDGGAGGGSPVGQRFELPPQDSGDVTGGFTAPLLRVAPDGQHAVIHAHDFTFQDQGRRRYWAATMTADGQLSAPSAWAVAGLGALGAGDCAGGFSAGSDEGFASATTYFAVCSDSRAVVRVVRLDGSPVGDSSSFPGGFGGAGLLDRAGGAYLAWDAFGSIVSRIDLSTLRVTSAPLAAGATGGDPLGALGRRVSAWLVPIASAKIFLSPGMILSSDGARLYVIGATAASSTGDSASTGIWVVDPATLAVLGHWPPTADFNSIAISADGLELYAAASATGAGPNAGPKPGNVPASVTVFDAATGTVKAIAGQLGREYPYPPVSLRFVTEGGSAAE